MRWEVCREKLTHFKAEYFLLYDNMPAFPKKTQALLNWQSTKATKKRIQAVLRQIVIKRDGGCLLRNSPETGKCGGYGPKSGLLILQAEHLHTRANSASFGDTRLVICLCLRHHGYYKPQHSDEYYKIVRELIGKERSALLTRVQEDRGAHRMYTSDWLMLESVLEKELSALR